MQKRDCPHEASTYYARIALSRIFQYHENGVNMEVELTGQ
jgi:hypothetical protein